MLAPAVITANSLLVWFLEGLMFGLGFGLTWQLLAIPFRRWVP